jgi:hypothetical protein
VSRLISIICPYLCGSKLISGRLIKADEDDKIERDSYQINQARVEYRGVLERINTKLRNKYRHVPSLEFCPVSYLTGLVSSPT